MQEEQQNSYLLITASSIDYSKFESFPNVPDEISAELLSSILECEVLAAVTDRYDFEISIKAAERKRRIEDSTHMPLTEINDKPKFPKSFQSYLGNSNKKTNMVKYLSKNGEEKTCVEVSFLIKLKA